MPRISDTRIAVGRALVVGTVIAWVLYLLNWLSEQFINGGHHHARGRVEAVIYLVTVTFLTGSALAYLTCRLGFFYRARDHRRMPRAALEHFFTDKSPLVTVIVPSYKEDARIIRATLLSAALQDYPDLRVVLLIDDPPNPTGKRDRLMLERARTVAPELQVLLDEPSKRFAGALQVFESRKKTIPVRESDMKAVAAEYEAAAQWMLAIAADYERVDHIDDFFVEKVPLALASDFSAVAGALGDAISDGMLLPRERLIELYRRLAWTFTVQLSSFERKQYVSLSHESNKAMNLNSYIGLMGGAYRDTMTVSGRELVPVGPNEEGWEIPEPDFVLTLDADSVLLPEYCLRLVHLMEQSEHADVAVAQTPYSAFPGSRTRLERIAGATTDLQYLAHQGMTYYGATFWVGANAVLRKRALDDVVDSTFVGSWEIRRYIQDRTVIEDTESTIDLRAKGWSLLNYPERLAYSATPPDFGSLCIQRRRWANGGILILPKMWRTRKTRAARGEANKISETFIRVNYMASVAWSSVSLLLLLAYPFNSQLVSPMLGLIALPYFAAMASDLKYCGYKRTDVFRVYGFNLILMPVNIAGFCNSMVQSLTAAKSVFGRTPKVSNRTVPDFAFVISPYLVTALAGWTLWQDWMHQHWVNFGYAAINTLLAAYAIVAFIGLRNSIADFFTHGKAWFYVPAVDRRKPAVKPVTATTTVTTNAKPDWLSVLHHGGASATTAAPHAEGTSIPLQRTHAPVRGRVFAQQTAVSDEQTFRTDFQPIVELTSHLIVGREALTRLDQAIPAQQLSAADDGAGALDLEILLARASVQAAAGFPREEWLGLNVSLALVRAGRALQVTVMRARRKVVLQLDARTLMDLPHAAGLLAGLPAGTEVALTAVEPHEKSLKLVQDLLPAFIKLDRGWVHGIHENKDRLVLVHSLAELAREANVGLIAEGIGNEEEAAALREVGVPLGQGDFLHRLQLPLLT